MNIRGWGGRGLAGVLVCLALSAQVWAADVLEGIYAKFADSFATGAGMGEGGEFLILANPGIGLTPGQLKDLYDISALLDEIPKPSRLYFQSGAHYSSIYGQIMEKAQVTGYQVQADRDKALDARRKLDDKTRPGQPTKEYAAYLRYQALYDAALDGRTIAQVENRATGKAIPPGLDQAVDDAMGQWNKLGFKADMETALAETQKFFDSSPGALFATLRDEFGNAPLKGNHDKPWLPVVANPPLDEWLQDQGWHPWSFQQADLRQQVAPKTQVPLAAGGAPIASIDPGLMASLSLTVEVKRVNISRPWLETKIFSAHTWRMGPTAAFSRVSTGNLADKDPGIMPMIVTGVLLARKLSLTAQWSGDAKSGATSLGPFALSGSVGDNPAPSGTSASGGLSLQAMGPQIIGFFCRVMPVSPTPDARYFN
jgi:hypothetical protein